MRNKERRAGAIRGLVCQTTRRLDQHSRHQSPWDPGDLGVQQVGIQPVQKPKRHQSAISWIPLSDPVILGVVLTSSSLPFFCPGPSDPVILGLVLTFSSLPFFCPGPSVPGISGVVRTSFLLPFFCLSPCCSPGATGAFLICRPA
jgi:hypothetical protein